MGARDPAPPSPSPSPSPFAAAVVSVLAFRLLDQPSGDAIHEGVSQGEPAAAPELDLEVLTAGDLGRAPPRWWRLVRDCRVTLHELRGIPLVVNFWTAGCAPCREEASLLEHAAREAGPGVLFLGVGSGDSAGDARDLVHALELSFQQVHNRAGEAARRWGVDGVRETFFVTREGEVVGHVVGAATAKDL